MLAASRVNVEDGELAAVIEYAPLTIPASVKEPNPTSTTMLVSSVMLLLITSAELALAAVQVMPGPFTVPSPNASPEIEKLPLPEELLISMASPEVM